MIKNSPAMAAFNRIKSAEINLHTHEFGPHNLKVAVGDFLVCMLGDRSIPPAHIAATYDVIQTMVESGLEHKKWLSKKSAFARVLADGQWVKSEGQSENLIIAEALGLSHSVDAVHRASESTGLHQREAVAAFNGFVAVHDDMITPGDMSRIAAIIETGNAPGPDQPAWHDLKNEFVKALREGGWTKRWHRSENDYASLAALTPKNI